MSREQLLSRLARVTPIVHSMPALARGRSYGEGGVRWFGPRLCGFRNPVWLPEIYRFPWLRRVLDNLRERYRRHLLQKMGGQGRPIRYIWHPVFADEAFRDKNDFVVYHIYDDYREMSGASPAVVENERRLLRRADVVICTSQATMEKRRQEVEREYHVITHGVDETFFDVDAAACPADIAAVPHPRLGYIGRLNRKVDFAEVGRIALAHPDWNIVFVGPFVGNPDERKQFDQLLGNPNVHWLGLKPVDDLPRYYAALDVSLLCYTLGGWIFDGSPLKLVESLAAGVPVVAAATAGCMQYADYLRMPEGSGDWGRTISAVLAEGKESPLVAAGKSYAKTQTWDAKALEIAGILGDAVGLEAVA